MYSSLLLLFVALWSIADAYYVDCHPRDHHQTFPYFAFMNQTLANHSYVNLSQVGEESCYETIQCYTDLETCCSRSQGAHRGNWYFPNGTRLPFNGRGYDIFQVRGGSRVGLHHRNNATTPSGIYRCDIPTDAVHDDYGYNTLNELLYVGLYSGSGGMQYLLKDNSYR